MKQSSVTNLLAKLERQRTVLCGLRRAVIELNNWRATASVSAFVTEVIPVDDSSVKAAIRGAMLSEIARIEKWINRTERRIARWK